MRSPEKCPRIIPRRDFLGVKGYKESDKDYAAENLAAAVYLLDRELRTQKASRRKVKP